MAHVTSAFEHIHVRADNSSLRENVREKRRDSRAAGRGAAAFRRRIAERNVRHLR